MTENTAPRDFYNRVDAAAAKLADHLIAASLSIGRVVAIVAILAILAIGMLYVLDAVSINSPDDVERFQPDISATPREDCVDDAVPSYRAPLTGQPIYVGGC